MSTVPEIERAIERLPSEELARFRAEAAELLGVDESKRRVPSTAPATPKSQPAKE